MAPMVYKSERWKELVDSSNVEGKHIPIEPTEISIRYVRDSKSAETEEVVHEDANENSKPRLLVSLKSVLKMKGLCEHEHARRDDAEEKLKHCRTAYYKEIRWLRDQLSRVCMQNERGRRSASKAEDKDFEVFWYDPPKYMDAETQEFLKDCIRETTKRMNQEIERLKDQARSDEAVVREAQTTLAKMLDTKLEMEKVEKKVEAEQMKTRQESDRADEAEQKMRSQQEIIEQLQNQASQLAEGEAELARSQKKLSRPLARIQEELQVMHAKSLGDGAATGALSAPNYDLDFEGLVSHMEQANKDFALLRAVLAEEKASFESQLSGPSPAEQARMLAELKQKHARELEDARKESGSADEKRKEMENRIQLEQDRVSKLEEANKKLLESAEQNQSEKVTGAHIAEINGLKEELKKQKQLLAKAGDQESAADASKRSDMEVKMKEAQERISKLKEEAQRLHADLVAEQKRCANIDLEADKIRSENVDYRSSTETLQAEVEKLRRKLKAAKRQRQEGGEAGKLANSIVVDNDDENDAGCSSGESDMSEDEFYFLQPYNKRKTMGKRRWQLLAEDAEYKKLKYDYEHDKGHSDVEYDASGDVVLRLNPEASRPRLAGVVRSAMAANALASMVSQARAPERMTMVDMAGRARGATDQQMTMVDMRNPEEEVKSAFSFLTGSAQQYKSSLVPRPSKLMLMPKQPDFAATHSGQPSCAIIEQPTKRASEVSSHTMPLSGASRQQKCDFAATHSGLASTSPQVAHSFSAPLLASTRVDTQRAGGTAEHVAASKLQPKSKAAATASAAEETYVPSLLIKTSAAPHVPAASNAARRMRSPSPVRTAPSALEDVAAVPFANDSAPSQQQMPAPKAVPKRSRAIAPATPSLVAALGPVGCRAVSSVSADQKPEPVAEAGSRSPTTVSVIDKLPAADLLAVAATSSSSPALPAQWAGGGWRKQPASQASAERVAAAASSLTDAAAVAAAAAAASRSAPAAPLEGHSSPPQPVPLAARAPPRRREPAEGRARAPHVETVEGSASGDAWVASLMEPRWKDMEKEIDRAQPSAGGVAGSTSTDSRKTRFAAAEPFGERQQEQEQTASAVQSSVPAKAQGTFSYTGRWLAKDRSEQLPFTNTPSQLKRVGQPHSSSTPDLQGRFHSSAATAAFRPDALPALPPGRGSIRPPARI